MPIYTLKCGRCDHVSEQGFTVAAFVAQEEQKFLFLRCGRCNRRGSLAHDFMADARTQVVHHDAFKFGENAPEEHLVNKTVTKAEAKAILKKHGLVVAGKEAKRKSSGSRRTVTEKDIISRWNAPVAKAEEPAPVKEKVPDPASLDKQVDKTEVRQDTIVARSWPALKAQAKRLGVKAPVGTKRPELEQLVRDKIAG